MRATVPEQVGLVFGPKIEPREQLQAAAARLGDDRVLVLVSIAERLERGSKPRPSEPAGRAVADALDEAREQILELACEACEMLRRFGPSPS